MRRPISALIADDEPHVRVFVRLLLKQLGVTTFWEAADGEAAVKMAVEHAPDVMLLDINMPRMGGIDVLRALNTAECDVPVIMMTSQDAMKTVLECRKQGAIAYVLKHLPKTEALRMLRAALDEIANADDLQEESGA